MNAVVVQRGASRWLLAIVGAAALVVAACGSEVTGGGGGGATTTHQGAAGGGTTSSGTGGTGAAAGGGGTSAGGGGVAGSGGSGIECNPSESQCYAPTPACPVGEVPSVVDNCWGPCVPILQCATEPNCDSCDLGFCIEYQAWTIEYRCVIPTLQCSALACSCLAPYVCVDSFDSCQDAPSGDHDVSCSCPTC